MIPAFTANTANTELAQAKQVLEAMRQAGGYGLYPTREEDELVLAPVIIRGLAARDWQSAYVSITRRGLDFLVASPDELPAVLPFYQRPQSLAC